MSRDGRSDWLKAALFVLALVPMSSSVPIRCGANIWLGFALLVPVAVGVTVGVHSPSGRVRITQSMIRGFPVTSLAAAFLVLPITVPALRIASMLRGQYDPTSR